MSSRSVGLQIAAGVAAVVVAGTVVHLALKKKWRRKYVKVGKVSKLLIYPVKACAAMELETANCTKSGVKHGIINDRMWSIIDEEGIHVDQRKIPRLVLLQAQPEDGKLCVTGPGMEPLKLEILTSAPEGAKIVKCEVFGTLIDAVDCGEEAAMWIQKFSGKPDIRMVQYIPEFKPRPSDMRGLSKLKGEKYPILFQSGHTYLFLSEASVEDLNSKMEDNVTYLNFRPNIVVTGCEAFDEDKWKYAKIGETAIFVKTTSCDRCVITTVDTKTGKKSDKEPLVTLRKYRQAKLPREKAVFKYSPLFGMNYAMEVEGKVSVGDDVYAVYE